MKLISGIIELKPNWFVRLPRPMTAMEMLHWRFAPVFAVAGAGLQASGQIQEGRTAEAVGKYNEQIGEMQAKEIEAKTAFDQTRQAEEGARTMSSMEAGQAAAGGGGNLLALAKQQSELTLQNLMIGREGIIGAGKARAEGAMAKWQGKMAKKQSYLKAGGTLLTGFGSAMGSMGGGGTTGSGLTTSGAGGTGTIKGMPSGYAGMGW